MWEFYYESGNIIVISKSILTPIYFVYIWLGKFNFIRKMSGNLRNWDSTVVRPVTSHQCDLGSIRAQCHMGVEFVVGSLGAVFFASHSGFFHPKKVKNTG